MQVKYMKMFLNVYFPYPHRETLKSWQMSQYQNAHPEARRNASSRHIV